MGIIHPTSNCWPARAPFLFDQVEHGNLVPSWFSAWFWMLTLWDVLGVACSPQCPLLEIKRYIYVFSQKQDSYAHTSPFSFWNLRTTIPSANFCSTSSFESSSLVYVLVCFWIFACKNSIACFKALFGFLASFTGALSQWRYEQLLPNLQLPNLA